MKLTANLLMVTLTAFVSMMLWTKYAIAQVVLPGSVDAAIDWSVVLGQAIANPKSFTAAMIGALVVYGLVQALKSERFKGIFKKIPEPVQFLVITILGQGYAILVSVYVFHSTPLSGALVGIFSSGGAASIYHAIVLVLGKPKAA